MGVSAPTLLLAGDQGAFTTADPVLTGSVAASAGDKIIVVLGSYRSSSTAYTHGIGSGGTLSGLTWRTHTNHVAGSGEGNAISVAEADVGSAGSGTIELTRSASVGYMRWLVARVTGAKPGALRQIVDKDTVGGATDSVDLAAPAGPGSAFWGAVYDSYATAASGDNPAPGSGSSYIELGQAEHVSVGVILQAQTDEGSPAQTCAWQGLDGRLRAMVAFEIEGLEDLILPQFDRRRARRRSHRIGVC